MLLLNLAGIPATWNDYREAFSTYDDLTNGDLHALLNVYESLTAASLAAWFGQITVAHNVLQCSSYPTAVLVFVSGMFLLPFLFFMCARHLGNSRNQQYALLLVALVAGLASGLSANAHGGPPLTAWPLVISTIVCYVSVRATYYVKDAPRQRPILYGLFILGVVSVTVLTGYIVQLDAAFRGLAGFCILFSGIYTVQFGVLFNRRGTQHPINQALFVVLTTMLLLWVMNVISTRTYGLEEEEVISMEKI